MTPHTATRSTLDRTASAPHRADDTVQDDTAGMSIEEAADFLGVRPSSLAKWRVHGGGPKFAKLGARVVYRRVDLRAWLAERLIASTSAKSTKSKA